MHSIEYDSLCGASLTTKNENWRIYTDGRAINKINIEYWFPIPYLEDMFNMKVGSIVISKVNLKSDYHQV